MRAAVGQNDSMESQIRTVLAAAYKQDPLMLWLFEGVDEPEHASSAWLNVFVERYLVSGHVELADSSGELAGVALWRLPGMSFLATNGLPTVSGLLAAFVGSERAQLLGQALHEIADLTPAEPHLYLHFLAVNARLRRTGVGAQLLEKSLSEARADKKSQSILRQPTLLPSRSMRPGGSKSLPKETSLPTAPHLGDAAPLEDQRRPLGFKSRHRWTNPHPSSRGARQRQRSFTGTGSCSGVAPLP